MDASKLLIILCFYVAALVFVNGQGGMYGHPCENDGNCINARDPMVCSTTLNVCRCHDEMFRHDELDRCVSPEGKNCTIQSGDGSQILTCTEFAQCWPDHEANKATCGKCHCDRDAKFDSATLKCKLSHGSTRCRRETDCDIMSLLTCKEGQCLCLDEENQDYNAVEKKCKVKVGGSCANVSPYPIPVCGTNMRCNTTTNLCECDDGFEETSDRTCGKKHDDDCQEDSECNSQFVCTGSPSKKCRYREGQRYNQGTNTCLLLVGQQCGTNETKSFECTLYAECANEVCACKQGYKADSNNTCMALFGSTCSVEEEIVCDSEEFLECKDGTCQCKANYESDGALKKCIGYIGQACQNNDNNGCIANSICSNNICRCQENQVENEEKSSCLALLDGYCDSKTLCSEKHFVTCHEAKCVCMNPDEQIADEENQRCVAKAGSSCDSGIPCVTNSTCSTDDALCRCDSGNVDDGEGLCVYDTSGSSSIFNLVPLLGLTMRAIFMGKFQVSNSCVHF